MTRIDLIHNIAERHGLSIVEFFTMEITAVFRTDMETSASYVAKVLEESPFADVDCLAGIESCVQKSWLSVSPFGTLVVTEAGNGILANISRELRDCGL
jgi:hypothetical protein